MSSAATRRLPNSGPSPSPWPMSSSTSRPAAAADAPAGRIARVAVGDGQVFAFRETTRPIPAYDRHHVQVYIADFSGPYRRLKERGLVTEESSQHQYRFENILDLDSGKPL